jgi:hypothetical protein
MMFLSCCTATLLSLLVFATALDAQYSCDDRLIATSVAGSSLVLIHGYNRGAGKWHEVVWGDDGSAAMGRIPKAVLVALQENATEIAFGTGVVGSDGVIEAVAHYTLFLAKLNDLRSFDALKHHEQSRIDALKSRVFLERTSQNTVSELRTVLQHCIDTLIERVFLVTSPTHVSRSVRDALVVIADEQSKAATAVIADRWRRLAQNVFATPSDVSYPDSDASMVTVFEPPHRSRSRAFSCSRGSQA